MSKETNRQHRLTPLYMLLLTLLLLFLQQSIDKVQHKVSISPRKTLLNCTLPYKRCILVRIN